MDVPPAVDPSLTAWVRVHPSYAYTVDAVERSPAGHDEAVTLRIAFDRAGPGQHVQVLRGTGAGTDISWWGGTDVVVRAPGILHIFGLRLSVRDHRLLSPRNNDIRLGDLSRAAACFDRNVERVQVAHLADTTTRFDLRDERGIHCDDADGDAGVTLDRITLAADGQPLLRERFVGEQLVDRWAIRDLQAPQ